MKNGQEWGRESRNKRAATQNVEQTSKAIQWKFEEMAREKSRKIASGKQPPVHMRKHVCVCILL